MDLQEIVLARHLDRVYFDVGVSILLADFELLTAACVLPQFIGQDNLVKMLDSRSNAKAYYLEDIHQDHVTRVQTRRPHAPGSTSSPNDTGYVRFADDLRVYLGLSAGREATIPHDRIYGLLGLVDTTCLPPWLNPNYNADFRTVYKDYSSFIMEATGYLDMLNCRLDPACFPGFPSWVPDFKTGPKWRDGGVACRVPAARGQVSFSEDGNVLNAQGHILDSIPADPSTYYLAEAGYEGPPFDALSLLQTILLPAARIRGSNVTAGDIFQELILPLKADWDTLGYADDVAILSRVFEQVDNSGYGFHTMLQDPAWERAQNIFPVFFPCPFTLCVGGKIAVLQFDPIDPGCLANSVVCVLKGAFIPTVFRPMSGKEGHYTLVGSCYISPGEEEGFDDAYFEGRELTTFHIH